MTKQMLGATVLAVCLASCSDGTPTEVSLTIEERLQATLEESFTQTNGKGISVSVLIPGRPSWTGVGGISHDNVPITARSVFGAGSITKTFTALTILRLVEEGYLDLDDPLHTWLPPYPHVDSAITIRQLLNHTGGLSDFADPPEWLDLILDDPARVWDMEEFFLETIVEPYFEKGTSWSYSTSGYLLLRMIIERITDSSLAAQYRTYIFDPLGLDDTYLVPGDVLPSDMAHGWFNVDGAGGYDDLTSISNTSWCTAVGGAIYTTSTDLARLGHALMHERSILNSDTYGEMTDFVLPSGHDEPLVRGCGLGLIWFDSSQVFGQELWGHSGNAIGYAAGMLYMIDYGVSIGITDNTEHGDAMSVLGEIMAEIVAYLEEG